MKSYITCVIIGLAISFTGRTQDMVPADFGQISTPDIYFNDGTYNGQNLLFYNEWVKGKLLTSNNTVIYNDSFLFNYDKIDQRLLITTDFRKVYQIDWREFKAILFYKHDTGYVYKHISMVSNKDLFQVLVNGENKYSLYKTIHTKVIKGSYGAVSFGRSSSSDKYLDVPEYCILFPNREYRLIHLLKRSAIERAFKLDPESEKVDDYLNLNNKEAYDEEDLKQLVAYLNKSSF